MKCEPTIISQVLQNNALVLAHSINFLQPFLSPSYCWSIDTFFVSEAGNNDCDKQKRRRASAAMKKETFSSSWIMESLEREELGKICRGCVFLHEGEHENMQNGENFDEGNKILTHNLLANLFFVMAV